MGTTVRRKLRFGDVAYAIGATPKTLRLWLQRGLVELAATKPEGGGWTEYTFRDIAILALVRSLTNFGVDVPSASVIANRVMSDHFFPMSKVFDSDTMTPGATLMFWVNRRLYIYRRNDELQMKVVSLWESNLEARAALAKALPNRAVDPNDANFNPGAPSGISALRRELEPAPVYISIDVETVLRTAFDRAIESANDGADEDAGE